MSPEAFRAALAGNGWDCIISDYSMPRFNGLAAIDELHATGKDIPFILVSGTIGEEVAVMALKRGARDYIMKDRLGRLVPAVEREIREAEGRREQKRTNEALQEIDQRFRMSFEVAPIGMALAGLAGNWLQVNSSLCGLLGYDASDMAGMTIQQITHPHDLEADQKYLRQMVSGENQSYHIEKRYTHKNGNVIWAEQSVSLVRDTQGKPSYFILQIHDITERREAERQIRLLSEALTSTRDCYILTDLEESILFVNPATTLTYGYPAEELIGRRTSVLHANGNPPFLLDAMHRQTAAGGWKGELLDRRKDGMEFPVELWTSVVRDDAGAPVAFVGVARDISDRKAAEAHLRESEEKFRLISENVADMIAVLTPDGKRVYNSPSYRGILGDPDALHGSDSFQEVHPDDREKVRRIFQETVRTGVGQRAEYRFLLRDGTVRDIDSQGSVIRGSDGNVTGVVVVSRDVTEQKRLEQQFLRAQRMESIGTLASGIAHDLNNVLAPIMMAIEMIRHQVSDVKVRHLVDTIDVSAQRGAAIVKQVLAFGRGVEGERIVLQLKHLINEVVKMAQETFPKSIEIRTDIARDLRSISGDPTQMQQVLMNLCVNARDAMPQGGQLRIAAKNATLTEHEARMIPDIRPGPYVVVSIADEGSGIPAKIQEKIFEPFFTTKEVGKGTGLGLSTVLGIVRSHKGAITLKSEEGKGTVFTIHIPAAAEGVEAGTPEHAPDSPTGHGELILVIDDEAAIREMTRQTLEASGYSVRTARSGIEGIAVFQELKGKIRAVVTDIMMPAMDGTAVIEALKKLRPDLRIIAASGLSDTGHSVNPSVAGADAYLSKPFTAGKLLTTLAKVLQA